MKPTLQQLFYGDLCPQRDGGENAPGTPTTYEAISHSQERFLKLLEEKAPELVKKFDILSEDISLGYVRDTEAMFCYGFGLAVKLLAEALAR